MNYTKHALSFREQSSLLISRGLIVDDPSELENYLQQVNYYRLSGYWFVFKDINPTTGTETFKPGTTFQMIQGRYEFDRKLRLLLLDAIERIEVAILRTRMVETHTNRFGPFGYADKKNYNPKFTQADFKKLLNDIVQDEDRSHEEFIRRYRSKYTSETHLPLWMATELMSFGQLLTLYRNQDLSLKQTIARQFELFPMVLDSWLLTLNYIRNSCAHHARLWNRPLPLKIKLPDQKHDTRWYSPAQIPNNTNFSVITVVQYLLTYILPDNQWKNSIQQLLAAYPAIPLKPMGFPGKWQDLPLWRQ
jgi:abortive infection bacteriophage resistance protein